MKEIRSITRLAVGLSRIPEDLIGLLSSKVFGEGIEISIVCEDDALSSEKIAAAGIKTYKGAEGVKFYLDLLRNMSSTEGADNDTTIIISGGAAELAYALKLFKAEKPDMKWDFTESLNVIICGGEIGYTDDIPYSQKNFSEEARAIKEILDSDIEPVFLTADSVSDEYKNETRCKEYVSDRLLRKALKAFKGGKGPDESQILRDCVRLHLDIAVSGENKGELLIDSRERPESPNARLYIKGGKYENLIEEICKSDTLNKEFVRPEESCPISEAGENHVKRVILDADTGSDDAISIMCAALCGRLEIEAICSVWGNSNAENTADNAARVMSLMGKRVLVYKGLDTAICKYQELCRRDRGNLKPVEVNGEVLHMHVDTLPIPDASYKREEKNAVSFYIEYFSKPENRGTSILATGPLSNLGLALLIKPDIAENIGEIIVMGGGLLKANITPFSEANFNHDPEAADIVLNCGTRVILIPLDLTHRAVIKKDEIEEIKALGNPCALFAAELLRQRSLIHDVTQPLYIPHAATVHDAMTAAYAADNSIVTKLLPVRIKVIKGGDCEGHCTLERRKNGDRPNCEIALAADREKFVGFIKESLAAFGKR